MSSFIRLKNKLIKKTEIALVEYYIEGSEIELEENEIRVVTIHGDNFILPYEDEQEFKDDIDYIKDQCSYAFEYDLYEINPGTLINLKRVTAIEFVKDKVGPNEVWVAQIYWNKSNKLPETIVLDEVDYTQDDIDVLLETIEERD